MTNKWRENDEQTTKPIDRAVWGFMMRVGFATTRVKNETGGEKKPDAQIRFDCLIGFTFSGQPNSHATNCTRHTIV